MFVAAGGLDPELLRCMRSAWSVAQIAAFQRVAHKFSAERQFQFVVLCTDLRCAESRAAQEFLAQHATPHTARGAAAKPNDAAPQVHSSPPSPRVDSTSVAMGSPQVGWLIWRPSHQQRCRLYPGPAPGDALANGVAEGQRGDAGGAPGWAAAVHVLDSTREECFRSAENALEAALSGSGDWEEAVGPFAV